MAFNTLRSIINSKYRQQAFSAALIVSATQNVVGDAGKVISFKNGILLLNVKSSVEAATIKAQKGAYIEKINGVLKSNLIKGLRFKVGE